MMYIPRFPYFSFSSLLHEIRPFKSTVTIALVLFVMRPSTVFKSIIGRSFSVGAKTTSAPKRQTALAVAINVKSGTITSSLGLMSIPISARASAALPLAVPMTYGTSSNSDSLCSNSLKTGPSIMCLSSIDL